jgi:NhaP-type Na+/H+ or K+/H+ antiporter
VSLPLSLSLLNSLSLSPDIKIHKHSKLHRHPPLELGMIVSFAYLSYIVAEEIKMSGIMSTLFCAIIMDHYTSFNISPDTLRSSKSLFTMLADVAESFVFIYLGMACFTFGRHDFHVGFTLLTLVCCSLFLCCPRTANLTRLSLISHPL